LIIPIDFCILVIAEADTREEIEEHWKWIEEHLMPTLGTILLIRSVDNYSNLIILGGIDAGVDVTDYVQCKIKSLCAQVDEAEIDGKKKRNIHMNKIIIMTDFESEKFKNATKKFHKFFNVPVDEKLVTCKCTIKKDIFHSFILFLYRLFLFLLAWACTSSRLALFIC
jgi:hypothetical protein